MLHLAELFLPMRKISVDADREEETGSSQQPQPLPMAHMVLLLSPLLLTHFILSYTGNSHNRASLSALSDAAADDIHRA